MFVLRTLRFAPQPLLGIPRDVLRRLFQGLFPRDVRITNIGMSSYTHPRIEFWFTIADALEAAARQLSREARARATTGRKRPGRGATLRPSIDTPLWNALVAAAKPRLRRRGDRALLARELGVHRARIGEFFDRSTAMPDAERTLELLLWLSHQAGPAQSRDRPRPVS